MPPRRPNFPGDVTHPFIARLKELRETNKVLHENIIYVRLKLKNQGTVVHDPRFRPRTVIENCLMEGLTKEHVDGDTVKSITLDALVKGHRLPSENQLRQIAKDHGLPFNQHDEFVAAGLAYVQHCQQCQQEKNNAVSHVEVLELSRQSDAYRSHTHEAIQQLLDRFGHRKGANVIIRRTDSEKLQPVSAGWLKVSCGASDSVQKLCGGNRPDIRKFKLDEVARILNLPEGTCWHQSELKGHMRKDVENIHTLCNMLGATEEEKKVVLDAYYDDIAKCAVEARQASRRRGG